MKRLIAFALTAVLALGFLCFSHASVTASQDDLLIYPTLEIGDRSPLEGLTADVSFLCGDYLRWDASYDFDGETTADFAFDPEGYTKESGHRAYFDVYLSEGTGGSTFGGSFSISNSGYGDLLRAASAGVGDNETQTTNLRMKDYVNYYLPDFEICFFDGESTCDQQQSLYGLITGDNWYESPGIYEELFQLFRFPVQENHIATVTVGKNELRQIVDLNMESKNSPQLRFFSDINENGLYFLPVFQDEAGTPLPYEAPEDHGIYHIPWTVIGEEIQSERTVNKLSPDLANLSLLLALDENLRILDMQIDAKAEIAWMLTMEDGHYIITRMDLSSGTSTSTAVLPHDPEMEETYDAFVRDDGYLLVTAQNQLALVSEETNEVLLTAPDRIDGHYRARNYDPGDGTLRFDGEYLILAESCHYRDGAFQILIFRQGDTVYYGEYDCSLLRGNDDWYYNSIVPDYYPIQLR